jgi:predicted permease
VPVAVISDGLWRRYFGADPAVLGRTIDIEGRAATIVGVTAREFFGLEPGRAIDVTLPLRPMQVAGSPLLSPRAKWLRLIGRLAPGVPRETAAADLDRLWRQAEMANGSKNAGGRLEAMSGAQGLNDLRREYSLPLRLLTLGVAALLVLACANLGSLLLARGRAREHEIGLRLALGAGRGRIVRQLLTESMILSAAGGLVGLAFANWGTGTIVSLLSRGRTPIEMDLALDLRVLAFTATVSLATGVVLGLLPSFRAAHRDLQPQLQASTRSATRHDRMRHAALVGVQTALSLVLVSGAVLFGRSLIALHRVDVGFEKDDVLLVGAPLRRLIPELQRRLHDLPNVRSVTLLMDAPPAGVSWTSGFSRLDGAPGSDTPMASFNFVGPRFFETLGIPLLEGRDFNADDDDRADHVAIVNQGLASRYFPGGSARGQRIRIGATVAEIVGVAKDVRYRGIRESAPDVIYRPYLQQPDGYGLSFAIRSDMPLPALADLVRREVRAAAPDIPVPAITPLDALYDGNITSERLLAVLSGFFGGMALVLVAIGVYGTLACDISRRRHEIGVRMALGADLRAIRRLLVGGALGPVAVGISVGLPAALAAGSLARRVLFGISASDPIAYGLCALVLLAIAVAAAWMPARRAGRIDPATSFGVYFG